MFRLVPLLQASSTRISRQQDGSFVKTFRTWGPPKRLALRWPAFDKRCSSCYTLRRCVFADIQTREEYRCSCKLEGNKVKNARPCSWLRLFCTSQKFLFVKLKSGSSCCSIITAAQMVNFSINNGRNVLKVKRKSKDLKEQTQMLINPTSHNLKRMTRNIDTK